MRAWTTLLGLGLAVTAARADEVNWTAGVPLWKGLSPTGQVIAAGPAPYWDSPQSVLEPAARLGSVFPPPVRPAPEGTPRPLELPGLLGVEASPDVLPYPRVVGLDPAFEQPRPFGRDTLVPLVQPASTEAVSPPETLLPPVRSVFRPIER